MKKIRFLFIALVITILTNMVSTVVLAEENIEQNKEEETTTQEVENILELVDEYIEQINTKIINIDRKINDLKIQREFDYYPAIRLNVDAPIFGLTSVVENKLRVKKDISTSDVANKYSIRDIVKNRTIRMPDSYLGAIVMSTKEYKINKDMPIAQAKLTLIKCIQYLSQINSVEDYIDTQTNNIFRDYISDEKKANINDVKERTRKVTPNIQNIADKIKKLKLLGEDVSEIEQLYNDISLRLYTIKNNSKNSLILEEDLNNLVKNSLNSEADIIDLGAKVNEKYEKALENMDYEKYLNNMFLEYKTIVDSMEKYTKSSTKTIEGEDDTKKTQVLYPVTSNATLDYLKQNKEEVKQKIDDLEKEKEQESNDENKEDSKENVEDTQIEEEKPKTDEEIKKERQDKIDENSKLVDELYLKYKDSVKREYNFYTSNINMLLKDSNDKMSAVIGQIDSGIKVDNEIFNYTKYIYIDLPDNLQKYIDENNIDAILELNNLNSLLKKELNNLSTKNTEINKLYEKVLNETLKS